MRPYFLLAILLIALALLWLLNEESGERTQRNPRSLRTTLNPTVPTLSAKASAPIPAEMPPPLEVKIQAPLSPLTAEGILEWTNSFRGRHGLPALTANENLYAAAERKLMDMFDREYFEHVSPLGMGLKEILEEFEYEGATVMLSPGAGFYASPGRGRDEVRIAYILNTQDLEAAMDCLEKALEVYPGKLQLLHPGFNTPDKPKT